MNVVVKKKTPLAVKQPKPVFNRERMEKALSTTQINAPTGQSQKEIELFILKHAD